MTEVRDNAEDFNAAGHADCGARRHTFFDRRLPCRLYLQELPP